MKYFIYITTVTFYFILPSCQSLTNDPDSVFTSCVNDTVTFKCKQDENCISIVRKCDGNLDCNDGSDETTCHPVCADDWFQCADGHCIHGSWRCDGHHDCMGGDNSDEDGCPDESQLPETTCKDNEFRCSDGLCILDSWKCDGESDCYVTTANGNAEDEDPSTCGAEFTGPTCPQYTCNSGQCILHAWVCDGENDCDDGTDEGDDLCGHERNGVDACELRHGMFPCHDGSRCLSPEHVCDNIGQCADRSDEGDWCQQSCDKHCETGCIKTPSGPQCFCKEGYKLKEDESSCEDINECLVFGSCSQSGLCENKDGGHDCSCMDGYKMINGTCLTARGEPVLIFSTINEIRAMSVRNHIYTLVDTNLPHAVGIGFDHIDTRVYWTDAAGGKETIMSKKLKSDEADSLVLSGLDMPEQLAVDEYNKNIYFTESHLKLIGVCSQSGKGCSILVRNLEKPRGIAIHHKTRHLFFSDWGMTKPAIVRLNLDGDNRIDLVTEGLEWPNGLAVDQIENRVYWADSKLDKIETVKIDGSDRREILTTHSIHPFSLAVYEDSLYWSDWGSREIVSCNKYNGKDYRVIVKEAGIRTMGLVVAHPTMLEPGIHAPCKEHECSHVCLPKPRGNKHQCTCPSDMILDQDDKTCIADPSGSKVLIATSDSFYVTNPRVIGKIQTKFASSIAPSSIEHVSSLTNGPEVYFSAHNAASSNIIALNTTNQHSKRLVTSQRIGSIAFDPLTANLFWVDVVKSAVMIHNVETDNQMELLQSLDVPQCLLFVPEINRLIIAHKESIVLVYLADKSLRHVSYPGLGHVSSMVYSATNNTIYIGDVEHRQILKLDIFEYKIAPFMTELNQGVRSMAVDNDVLYWIEEFGSNLLWVKDSRDDVSWQDLESVTGMFNKLHVATFFLNPENKKSSCHSASCSHFCFNKDSSGHVCKCPYGMNLDPSDDSSCVSTCKDDEDVFHCGEGECIPTSWVCDGTSDCHDESDEAQCDADREGKGLLPSVLPVSTTSASTTSTSTTSTSTTTKKTTSLAPTTTRSSSTSSSSISSSVVVVSTEKSTTSTLELLEIFEKEVEALEEDSSPDSLSSADDGKVTKTQTGRHTNGGVIALALILAFLATIIISLAFYKCRRNSKQDFSLSFTNSSFNRSTPNPNLHIPRIQQPEHEMNSVTIMRSGTTIGYDNPGFDSPWARQRSGGPRLLSTLDWPESPKIGRDDIVCDGSSTPSRMKSQDTDSAYQEPSLAPSSYSDINRHFSVGDDDEDSPYINKDKQRLLKDA